MKLCAKRHCDLKFRETPNVGTLKGECKIGEINGILFSKLF